jgi:hypothetical protein
MGFFEDARGALDSGLDAIDRKGHEIGRQARIREQEVRRSGVYAKLGERLYAAARTDAQYRELAPELFSQIEEIDTLIAGLEDEQARAEEEKADVAQARAADKAIRDELEAVRDIRFCSHCGTPFAETELSCSSCGAPRR